MPQLDKVTFLSQFFWLAFFYLAFYFLILKSFLPKMSRILKVRKKKISLSHEGVPSLNFFVINKVRKNLDTVVSIVLNASRTFICENYQRTSNWLHCVRYNTNQTHYENENNVYINSVVLFSLKENLALSQPSFNIPEKLISSWTFSKRIATGQSKRK